MSFFNDAQIHGMKSGEYFCFKCGELMEFEDEWEETLVCNNCGHSVGFDEYGFEGTDGYEKLYPLKEDLED